MSSRNEAQSPVDTTSTKASTTTTPSSDDNLYFEVTSHINHATNQTIPQLQRQLTDNIALPLVRTIRTSLIQAYNAVMSQTRDTTTSPSSPVQQSQVYLQRIRTDVFNTLRDLREHHDPRQTIGIPAVSVALMTYLSASMRGRPNKGFAVFRNTLLTAGVTSFILYPNTTIERTQLYISKVDRAVHDYMHHQPRHELSKYVTSQRLPCGCDRYNLQPHRPLVLTEDENHNTRLHFIDDDTRAASTAAKQPNTGASADAVSTRTTSPTGKPTLRPHKAEEH